MSGCAPDRGFLPRGLRMQGLIGGRHDLELSHRPGPSKRHVSRRARRRRPQKNRCPRGTNPLRASGTSRTCSPLPSPPRRRSKGPPRVLRPRPPRAYHKRGGGAREPAAGGGTSDEPGLGVVAARIEAVNFSFHVVEPQSRHAVAGEHDRARYHKRGAGTFEERHVSPEGAGRTGYPPGATRVALACRGSRGTRRARVCMQVPRAGFPRSAAELHDGRAKEGHVGHPAGRRAPCISVPEATRVARGGAARARQLPGATRVASRGERRLRRKGAPCGRAARRVAGAGARREPGGARRHPQAPFDMGEGERPRSGRRQRRETRSCAWSTQRRPRRVSPVVAPRSRGAGISTGRRLGGGGPAAQPHSPAAAGSSPFGATASRGARAASL